jgi:predicted alpha/beta superfamily hydrolase
MTDYVLHHLGPLDVPGLAARTVRVYSPPHVHRDAPAPVIYMFDGQNMFDDEPSYAGGWHLHKTARSLWKKHKRAPVIVGIDHGGVARIDELSPWQAAPGEGKIDALLGWLWGSVAPRIQAEFGVSADPALVGIGGSSMGGLAALYAHLEAPERCGLALSMSPSLWVANGRIFEHAASKGRSATSRIYLDAGGRESGGRLLEAARKLASTLRGRGWDDASLRFVEAKRGTHSEKDWRRRAPAALEFLFVPHAKRRHRRER